MQNHSRFYAGVTDTPNVVGRYERAQEEDAYEEFRPVWWPPRKPVATVAMRVTKRWIRKYRSAANGWTRSQLAAIGVPWPPPKGWMHRAHGTEITRDEQDQFERDVDSRRRSPR